MKKLILYIVLSVLFISQSRLNAQSTWDFVHTSWSIAVPDGFGGIAGYNNIRLDSLNEDTIINSVSYKKIVANINGPGYLYYYSIRSENHKVYSWGNSSFSSFPPREYLLYDFTANIGDTLRKVAIGDEYLMDTIDLYVADKDSFLLNNKYYITLAVHQLNGSYFSTWYENIGCPNGLLSSSAGISGPSLACYSNKDSLVAIGYLPYPNIHTPDTIPAYPGGNCFYELHVGINELGMRNEELEIYPNPCEGELGISVSAVSTGSLTTGSSTNELGMKEVKIYDVMGKIIMNYELGIRNEKSITINVEDLAKGMYFVEVHLSPALSTGERETTLRKKFIK